MKKKDLDSMIELAKMKLPLVERDYESYYEASTRELDRINQRRNLEVTLISALAVVIISAKTVSHFVVLPLYLLMFTFYFLDAVSRSGIMMITSDVFEIEEKLQVADVSVFAKNIVEWTFGNTISLRRTRRRRIIFFLRSLIAIELLAWHGGLTLAVSTLFIVMFIK